ncbi:conserved hypothetical protein [Desulfosarcina cetonica]|uniref:hypothetical protein n=1 Tax=Desulfosarcina cetonica TaxID=90730 RepID=UPI0006D0FACE|nr:hypothetical protein [Desulfosarcina cetonica]VTR67704.1 conserved hypothetical protein [Desulfosarcina cetonica]
MNWWEKTVEYMFVLNYFNYDAIIAPMDGVHERIGDALYSKENLFSLIEFKRYEADISREVDKYLNYAEARNALQERDSHHFFIYGKLENGLQLESKTYFSHKKYPDVSNALLSGINMDIFKDYVETLLKYKIPPKGGGGTSLDDYMQVACVRNDGQLICCVPLNNYLDMFEIERPIEKSANATA